MPKLQELKECMPRYETPPMPMATEYDIMQRILENAKEFNGIEDTDIEEAYLNVLKMAVDKRISAIKSKSPEKNMADNQ